PPAGPQEAPAAGRGEPLARDKDVLFVGPAPERDDGLVLEEEERVADGARDSRRQELLLERQRVAVTHTPEPPRLELTHRSSPPWPVSPERGRPWPRALRGRPRGRR